MRADPAVRADGTCRTCRGERPALALADGDPFCSTECCQRHHGTWRALLGPRAVKFPSEVAGRE